MGDKIGGYLPVSDFLNTAVKGLGWRHDLCNVLLAMHRSKWNGHVIERKGEKSYEKTSYKAGGFQRIFKIFEPILTRVGVFLKSRLDPYKHLKASYDDDGNLLHLFTKDFKIEEDKNIAEFFEEKLKGKFSLEKSGVDFVYTIGKMKNLSPAIIP